MRLIDADALKKELRTNEGARVLRHSVVTLFAIDGIVDAQPTVDAVEVVHGHWIAGADGSYMCSECGKVFRYEIGNYCSHCGAKMDGDEDA